MKFKNIHMRSSSPQDQIRKKKFTFSTEKAKARSNDGLEDVREAEELHSRLRLYPENSAGAARFNFVCSKCGLHFYDLALQA